MFWQPTRGILQPNQHWRRPQKGAPAGITLTAGSSGPWRGYQRSPLVGSITGQPYAGLTLDGFKNYPTGGSGGSRFFELQFLGDVTSTLNGKTLYVDGVPYVLGNDPSYYPDDDYTQWYWDNSTGPNIVSGNSYIVAIV